MRLTVGAKIALGFALTLFVFVIIGLASYRAVSDFIEVSDARKQTFTRLDHLEEPLTLLKDLELGSRSYYLTDDVSHLQRLRAASDRLPLVLQRLRQIPGQDVAQQQRLDLLEPLVRSRIQHVEELLGIYRTQGRQAVVQRIIAGQGAAMSAEITRIVQEMQAHERQNLQKRTEATEATGHEAQSTIVVGTALALLLAAAAGFLIARNVSRPLGQLTRIAERAAAGDVRVEVPRFNRTDEVGVLSQAIRRMAAYLTEMATVAERMAQGDLRSEVRALSDQDAFGSAFSRMSSGLREQLRQMVDATGVLASSSSQIVAATAQLAATSSQSAAAVAETSATVEEVRHTAELSAQKARHVSDTAQRAVQDTQEGRKAAEEMASGVERIRTHMEVMVGQVARLSEYGQSIGQIIATVEDISVQSNLLAVNAAIEAAKAGEHGHGFGVVAQEVRHLAAQSREATSEVRRILGNIQAATTSAVTAMQDGGRAVEAGSRDAEVARGAIEALSGSINEAAQAATQIAASSQQQLVGVDQLASAMESIRQASSQNTLRARDLEGATRNLNRIGQELQQTVKRYVL